MSSMLFSEFSRSLSQLESISSRLEMTEVLAGLYRQLSAKELAPASYMMLGSLVPIYQSLEFQLSVKMTMRTLAKLTDDLPQVEQLYKQLGDLGAVAEQVLAHQTDTSLTIVETHQQLVKIAQHAGGGSQQLKVDDLSALLTQLDAKSAKFVVRIVIGKLRLGFSTRTIIDALSWAVAGDKSQREVIEKAYQKKADIGELARVFLRDDADQLITDPVMAALRLKNYDVEVGIPLEPALCQRLNTAVEIVEKVGQAMVEPKYDGLRAQIHFDRQSEFVIKVFTRNFEDVTHMYPELHKIATMLKCQSCILDAEAIGLDPATGKLVAFQQTITRKRKHQIGDAATKVPLRFYVFDVMALDGRSLLGEPLSARKKILDELFAESSELMRAPVLITSDPAEIHRYHQQLLAEGLEGAVVKKIESAYVGGRTGWRWVKIKEAEGTSGKLTDTLDLIVMGYYAGRGKRSQFGLGALLVGLMDQDRQLIKTIAKIGTGLTEQQLVEVRERCNQLRSTSKPANYVVEKSLIPDVWVNPGLVLEIAADEITKSPVHTAGVALRFPRLIRFRDDKGWEDATNLTELAEY